ncbi:MAG TPA: c-type cytochrome [Polyangiaceae bacterium]
MHQRIAYLAFAFGLAGMISVGCGSDDDTTPSYGGAGGMAGKSGSAGKGGSSGTAGESGSAGEASPAGSAGTEQGGAAGAEAGGAGGEGGAAGSGSIYSEEQIERGKVIVRSMALCGGCHTATNGSELGGNAAFKNSTLPAPNLTNDATGIGEWTDAQVMNAFRNGIDDEGRHLDPIMPYWLFHNMTDADALSVVAFLRSVPKVVAELGADNPEVAPVQPLAPSALPNSSLISTDADYAAAQQGKYLVSSVVQCVKCHSPASQGFPIADFFSGVPPANNTAVFAPNITFDDSGIGGWEVADVVTALKAGTNKAGRTLCSPMPSPAKGYGGMTEADAHAISVYLKTIPPVSKPAADPDLEPGCQ